MSPDEVQSHVGKIYTIKGVGPQAQGCSRHGPYKGRIEDIRKRADGKLKAKVKPIEFPIDMGGNQRWVLWSCVDTSKQH